MHPAGRGELHRRQDRCAGAVHEVMPAEADARAEKHRDNRTKAVGSQLRSVHSSISRSWSETRRCSTIKRVSSAIVLGGNANRQRSATRPAALSPS